jgi:hypothetical protein
MTAANSLTNDPNSHARIGSLSAFSLNSKPLAADITAYTSPGTQAKVVGLVEKVEWNGGMGDMIKVEAYVSQENAVLIKSLQQSTLKTTTIDFTVAIQDYDQQAKGWYAQMQAGGTLHGMIGPKDNPELNVDLSPASLSKSVNAKFYKVTFSAAPVANKQAMLTMCSAKTKCAVKPWGLVVGTLATSPK